MEEPTWKHLKLSLERPYRDDNGDRTPVLLDILPDGQHIYERRESPEKTLGKNLRRIFVEKGTDFFDKTKDERLDGQMMTTEEDTVSKTNQRSGEMSTAQFMTAEELMKMRAEIAPQLFTSLGEISLARDLLSSLLASSEQSAPDVPTGLSATVVSRPPTILSVKAFNTQLSIGSKDEALRKATSIFKSAADGMERGRIKGEKYWVDALKVRRGNWSLIPAPLPFGSVTGRGSDKTSKDFLISYGLEESPVSFRRQALARMAADDTTADGLVFNHRQRARLHVSVTTLNQGGTLAISRNRHTRIDPKNLEGSLQMAQQEVIEQEIFSFLVQEAGNLPTASARVSERLIVIDAALGTELKFELLDNETSHAEFSKDAYQGKCNLIFFAFHVLLLRRHEYLKMQRLGSAGITLEASRAPPILQPVIDLLQYQVFCERIKSEIDKMISALSAAGIPASLRFNPVGEIGNHLIEYLETGFVNFVGGEAILRVDDRHTIRLTFLSPSSLTAHLSQATLMISSIPQLSQLLTDEVERCLLQWICQRGREICERISGTWFIDLSQCVGRWEGCVLNFRLLYGNDFSLDCSAFQLHKKTSKQGRLDRYSSKQHSLPLLSWVENIINNATSSS